MLFVLAACGDDELILEGERLAIRENGAASEIAVARAQPLQLASPVVNANWSHTNGSPSHNIVHPALDRSLARVWSASIGQGNDRKHRVTADPVIADGRIYTLDSRALVSAFSTSGNSLWSRDLTPSSDNSDDASGGGLAVAGGTLFVTSGFGILTALDATTGETLWTQDLDSAASGAPTAVNGAVYVVTRNATGWAIDAQNGRVLWQVLGAPSGSGILGGPGPVVAGPLVVFPFASGQLLAVAASVGSPAWVASVGGQRPDRSFSRISDLSGNPVADGTRIYAGNHSGRTAAFDSSTGQPVWTADEGAMNAPWLAGGSLFFVTDENQLIRLDAATGQTVWARELPFFRRSKISRRKSTFAHHGPVLAGGRLILTSDDGVLREFDAETGSPIAETELPDGAARNPVVAGGTLFVVTENGQIHAFR
jgi:outer membrane protein assembly factor BamB